MKRKDQKSDRMEIIDWLKAWAILAVILDHMKMVPEHFVVWSVNVFVLVTAAVYSVPGYVVSAGKLVSKLLYLAYIYCMSVLIVDLLFGILHEQRNRALLSVLLNPFYIFVRNPYLGDIWYLGLHVQILAFFYLFLKFRGRLRTGYAILIAAWISQASFLVTHYGLHHFETILVTSWLFFLALGFYAMRPLIAAVRTFERSRFLFLTVSAGILVMVYACYPAVPWLFQNENRASLLTPPLYFGLILFLSELFFLLERFPAGKILTQAMSFIGRYTLSIYLTHQAFGFLWNKVFDAPLLLAVMAVLSGVIFGMITDSVYAVLNRSVKRIFGRPSCLE